MPFTLPAQLAFATKPIDKSHDFFNSLPVIYAYNYQTNINRRLRSLYKADCKIVNDFNFGTAAKAGNFFDDKYCKKCESFYPMLKSICHIGS